MAGLKETKDRIQSVKNTQKITRAMKMVAAAKVKKAENSVKLSRPFALELFKTFVEIYDSIEDKKFENIKTKEPLDNYKALLEERQVKTIGLVIISSNKGLAGAYNANLIRLAASKIKEANSKNIKVELFLVGSKVEAGLRALEKEYDFNIKEVYTGILDDVNTSSARIVASDLAKEYINLKIDKIELITTRYINMLTYSPESWTLLPVIHQGNKNVQAFFKKQFDKEHKIEYKTFFEDKKNTIQLFEPNQTTLLKQIVPMYITNLIYQAILEAQASELASRMTAMSAATKNAEDMINNLTIQYNKARQQSITQEITEVISGTLNK